MAVAVVTCLPFMKGMSSSRVLSGPRAFAVQSEQSRVLML